MSRSLNPGYTKYNSHLFLFYFNIYSIRLKFKKTFKKLNFKFFLRIFEKLKMVLMLIFLRINFKLFGLLTLLSSKDLIYAEQNCLLAANFSYYKRLNKRLKIIGWSYRVIYSFPFLNFLKYLPWFLRYKIMSSIRLNFE